MSEKPASMQVGSLERASQVVTDCAVALPLMLAYMKTTTDLPSVVWGLGLSGWILLGLIAGMLRCTVYLSRRADEHRAQTAKEIKCVRDSVKTLSEELADALSNESRATRAAAIAAALDDNVTSINHSRR